MSKRRRDSAPPARSAPDEAAPGPRVRSVGDGGSHEVVLPSVPPGTTSWSLRIFLAEAAPLHIALEGTGAVVRLASREQAEQCARRWQASEAAVGSGHALGRPSHATRRAANEAKRAAAWGPEARLPARGSWLASPNPTKAGVVEFPDRSKPRQVTRKDGQEERVVEFPDANKRRAKDKGREVRRPSDDSTGDAKAQARGRMKELTRKIAWFAAKRQLPNAVAAFQHVLDEGLVPTVHACANLINAHVNSGDLAGAARAFETLRALGHAANVVVYTTLLKGHSRVGDVCGARALLAEMVRQDPPLTPDLRCINTVLRGCLRIGDVTAARAIFRSLPSWRVVPDAAARKFLGALLCQALEVRRLRAVLRRQCASWEARTPRVRSPPAAAETPSAAEPACKFWARGRCNKGDKCRFFHDPGIPQQRDAHAEAEHLDAAISLSLDVARAAALLGSRRLCRQALRLARGRQEAVVSLSRTADPADNSFPALQPNARLEQDLESALLEDFLCSSDRTCPDLPLFLSHTFLFPPRDLSPPASPAKRGRCGDESVREEVAALLTRELYRTFGLKRCAQLRYMSREAARRRFRRCLSPDGRLLWPRLFAFAPHPDAPVKLELCAGTGEWAAAQARAEGDRANWAALELMRDRAHKIFCRMALGNVRNLCVLGGDAAEILPRHISGGSVAHVFINFPEPPHVSGSDSAESRLHLLTAPFFRDVHNVLRPSGHMTIMSDNGRYVRTLASTLAGLRSPRGGGGARLFRSVRPARSPGGPEVAEGGAEEVEGVVVHHGRPGPESGHLVDTSSFFDSLWQSGARTARFFMLLEKVDAGA